MQLAIPWRSLGWLLVLALSSGVVGWLLITSSRPHLPAALSSLLLLLEPAAALALAAIVLDQRASLIQITGAVLVCGGVLTATRNQDRDHRKAVTGEMATPAATMNGRTRSYRRPLWLHTGAWCRWDLGTWGKPQRSGTRSTRSTVITSPSITYRIR